MPSRHERLFPAPDPGERIHFAFVLDDGRELVATVGEMAEDGLAVRCDRAFSLMLTLGAVQEVRLHGARLEQPLRTRALVRSRRIERTSVRYGLGLGATDSGPEDELLKALFNPRRHVRVTPAPTEPVEVELHLAAGGCKVKGALVDISLDGMAVRVPQCADSAVAAVGQVVARLRLPDPEADLRLCATPVYGEFQGDEIRYGMEFARGSTSESERMRDLLSMYVARRQAEMIRKAAG